VRERKESERYSNESERKRKVLRRESKKSGRERNESETERKE
jgi:hypothetical protein